MILEKMSVENFRQFNSRQEIIFATGEKNKNVTVIYGLNGRGKTSLYRALMFCLYGEKKLAQDSEESVKEISLVNKVALNESAGQNKAVEALVEIEFSHKDEKYILKRALLGMISEDEEYEEPGEVVLKIIKKDGNADICKDTDKINQIINGILDKRVREYFLFDGEKIERLTRTDREQKKEIETGIKNLLNIDRLFVAQKGLEALLKRLTVQLKAKSTGEYKKQAAELEKKQKEQNNCQEEIGNLNNEFDFAEKELRDIDKSLEKYQEISQYLKRRLEIQKEKGQIESDRNVLLSEKMINVNDHLGLMLVEGDLKEVDELLSKKVTAGELPSERRAALVDRIIKEKECICGRGVEENAKEYTALLDWKNKVISRQVEVETSLLRTNSQIGRTREFLKHEIDDVEQCLQAFSLQTEQIDRLEQELQIISDELGDKTVNEDIPELENSRKGIIVKKGRLEQKLEDKDKKLKEISEKVEELEKIVKQLEAEEGVQNILAKRCNLAREAKLALGEIYLNFTDEIKTSIGKHASTIFHKLIDDQGSMTFSDIKITADYSLQLFDKRGKPFLTNISAGQRQITSIAFISSLAQIAGGKDILEIPLFMDTPFGRLSGEHRDNLISNIPKLAKQWILLATDTEFTQEEAKQLSATKQWGKIYTLEGEKPFITKIEEKSVTTFTPTRSTIKRKK